jgi:signal transduction histidine kinase
MTSSSASNKNLHDLRNAIGAMQMAVDLLLKFPDLDQSDRDDALNVINRQLLKLSDLVAIVTEQNK